MQLLDSDFGSPQHDQTRRPKQWTTDEQDYVPLPVSKKNRQRPQKSRCGLDTGALQRARCTYSRQPITMNASRRSASA